VSIFVIKKIDTSNRRAEMNGVQAKQKKLTGIERVPFWLLRLALLAAAVIVGLILGV
jgi:hypothetical protein